jgi:DNA polymerase-3 subunit gamma/tau
MPLYTKYRCTSLDELIGNDHVKIALSTIFEKDDKPHTFLLTGEAGTGKTTTARIIANELQCSKNDLYEMDIGYASGVDHARNIKENCIYPPMFGRAKVYILDECQSASKNFWDASLKILEEPPSYVYFILCTTDPQKIPKTIATRATKLKFNLLNDNEMLSLIERVIKSEGFNSFPKEAIHEIVSIAKGSPREALNLLDLVIEVGDDDDVIEIIKSHSQASSDKQVIDLCRALIKRKSWREISKILKDLEKVEEEKIRRSILGYAMKVLLDKGDEHSANIINEFKDPFYNSGRAGLVLACFACISE